MLFPGLRSEALGNDEKQDTPRKGVRSAPQTPSRPNTFTIPRNAKHQTRNAKRSSALQILFEEVDSLCFDELAHLGFVRDVCGPANRREVEIFAGSL
jgi:hypothetical protein